MDAVLGELINSLLYWTTSVLLPTACAFSGGTFTTTDWCVVADADAKNTRKFTKSIIPVYNINKAMFTCTTSTCIFYGTCKKFTVHVGKRTVVHKMSVCTGIYSVRAYWNIYMYDTDRCKIVGQTNSMQQSVGSGTGLKMPKKNCDHYFICERSAEVSTREQPLTSIHLRQERSAAKQSETMLRQGSHRVAELQFGAASAVSVWLESGRPRRRQDCLGERMRWMPVTQKEMVIHVQSCTRVMGTEEPELTSTTSYVYRNYSKVSRPRM